MNVANDPKSLRNVNAYDLVFDVWIRFRMQFHNRSKAFEESKNERCYAVL